MGYTLIITEKPQAAKQIANALSDGSAKMIKKGGAYYFEFARKGKRHFCVPAVGHLFVLDTANSNGWNYPVFDLKWVPTHSKKDLKWTEKYYQNIQELAKKADEFIDAADYDTEGEVLLFNILKFICDKDDAKRMKFSTLTKSDIIDAYENVLEHIDFGQAEAGLTRHYLDAFWGFNTTRALTKALNEFLHKGFTVVSTGRVQGPTLAILTKKEREIKSFKSVPFWVLELKALKNEHVIPAIYEKERIFDKIEAKKIFDVCRNKDAKVKDIETKKYNQLPPTPFDTTTLQTESYRCFGFSPTQTLNIAESLYTQGYISYPRTSSQKLPPKIGYKLILSSLGKMKMFENEVVLLLKKSMLKPKEGSKEDSAHPAIFPTAQTPNFEKLSQQEKKVYELVARRFLATFGDPAVRESMKVTLDVNNYNFIANGVRTLSPGWTQLYGRFVELKEELLPELKIGEILKVKELKMQEKKTQPPSRYSQASILKEMEKEEIGTKCMTGDSFLLSPNMSETKMEDLWKGSKFLCYENDVEIRKLNTPVSISLDEKLFSIEFTKPKLISRRELKEDEKIFKITTNGGEIKVTEDHPIYLYNNGVVLKSAKKVLENDEILSIITKNKFGEILATENWFLERNFKIRNGMFVHKLSNKESLGVTKESLPIKWSSDLAWILGYFYGDGSYNPPIYNGSHQLYFATTEKKALEILKIRIKRVFGVSPKAYNVKNHTQYKVQCNSAIATLLADTIPEIKNKQRFDIPNEFIGDFLRGFFDADGNVHLRDMGKINIMGKEVVAHGVPRVKITLASRHLIQWIKELLERVGIETKIHEGTAKLKEKHFKCFTIRIGKRDNVDKFAWKVGFDVDHKKNILYQGLLSNSPRYSKLKARYAVAIALKKEDNVDKSRMLKLTNCGAYEVKEALKHLVKLGVVKRNRLSPYNKPPNRILYQLIDKDYYIHALKATYKHISGELYTSKVIKTEEIKSDDKFVYDISVSLDSPNFITSGSLLVHNSTRASILQTLYDRGYIKGRSIEVTQFGEQVVKVLEEYSPKVISVELTRKFEEEMEMVSKLEKKREEVVEEAKELLVDIMKDFKENENKIGEELSKAYITSKQNEKTIGICPKCGKDLRIIVSRKTKKRFVGCSGYSDGCDFSTPLPQTGTITTTDKKCQTCGYPIIHLKFKGKRIIVTCINMKCPTKENLNNKKENASE